MDDIVYENEYGELANLPAIYLVAAVSRTMSWLLVVCIMTVRQRCIYDSFGVHY